MREMMKHSGPLPGGRFFAGISSEIDEAVNHALGRAQRGHGVEVIRDLEAIAWFDRAIAIFPHCAEVLINRANVVELVEGVPPTDLILQTVNTSLDERR